MIIQDAVFPNFIHSGIKIMKLGSIYRIPPTFNILSLGERGEGKTVFLVGSYAEFKQNIETLKTTDNKDSEDAPMSWFECQQTTERALLNSILQYVQNQGVYPPPTLKISDFHFAFKQQQANQRSTLCFIRWWDMPGEYCDFDNPYYQEIGASSHGCCIFINANRLIHDAGYGATFSELKRQLTLLISLIRFFGTCYAKHQFISPITYAKKGFPCFDAQFMSN